MKGCKTLHAVHINVLKELPFQSHGRWNSHTIITGISKKYVRVCNLYVAADGIGRFLTVT